MKDSGRKTKGIWCLALLALFASLFAGRNARAELLARGGTDLDHGNYPVWYQDTNGLALELCADTNGLCLGPDAAEPPIFDPALPLDFPDNWPSELFYFLAESDADFTVNGDRALAVLAIEAAFGNEVPADGDQVVFQRIRFRMLNPPETGAYIARHPWGQDTFDCTAGETCTFSKDIGITPLAFDLALNVGDSNTVGPFLLASDSAGGDPLPFILHPATGRRYLANPAAATKVTGGTVRNFVELRGPSGTVIGATDNFILMGKVMGVPISPASHIFHPQSSGAASLPATFTVANIDTANSLGIGTLAITGASAADFQLVSDTCSAAVLAAAAPPAAPSQCAFSITFSGAAGATLVRRAAVSVPITAPAALPDGLVVLEGEVNDNLPKVVSISPLSASISIITNTIVTAAFDKPMDPATISNATFQVSSAAGLVPGNVFLDVDNNRAVFIPSVTLAANTQFTATVTVGARDMQGHPLETNFNWNFMTGAQADTVLPFVVSNTPPGNASGIAIGDAVRVTFSEPMAAHSINSSTFTLSGTGNLQGTVTFDAATSTAAFTPSAKLAFGQVFTATIKAEAADMANNGLGADHTFSFISDVPPASPELISPAEGDEISGGSVTLVWKTSSDSDGDRLAYHIYNCTNAHFLGCESVEKSVAALDADKGEMGTLFGSAGWMSLLAGLFLMGSVRSRKKFLVLLVCTAVTGAVIMACGGSEGGGTSAGSAGGAASGGGGGGGSVDGGTTTGTTTTGATTTGGNAGILSLSLSGLQKGATYSWKVVADDGKGGLTESAVRTFTVAP